MTRGPRRVRVAIAGFGPFPGMPRNPSAEVVRAILRMRRFPAAGIELASAIFPTAYAKADAALRKLLDSKPDALVMFGVHGRSREVRIETLARNAVSTLHPDQSRITPAERKLAAAGTAMLRNAIPAAYLVASARRHDANARASFDAGSYLCNAVFYRALAETRGLKRQPLILFVHIPMPRGSTRRGRPRRVKTSRQPPTLAALVRAGEAIVWTAAHEAARRIPVSDRDG